MVEVIGYITIFSVLFGLMVLQYSLMSLGLYKKDLNKIESIIGWIPLLPFILMIIVGLSYILSFIFRGLNKWFEINWGWIFINGRKRAAWAEYLRKKYQKENDA